MVYMADFNNETERPYQAMALYRRMLAGEFGALSLAEDAYARYGLIWGLWAARVDCSDRWQAKKLEEETISQSEKFLTDPLLRRSVMAPRVIRDLATLYGNFGKTDKSLEMYRIVANEYPQCRFADEALFQSAFMVYRRKDALSRQEAIGNLKKLINKHGKSPYLEISKDILKKLEEKS